MIKRVIFLIVLVLVFIGLSKLINKNKENVYHNDIVNTLSTTTVKYINDEHKYSIEYPSNLGIREYSKENVSIGTIMGETIDGGVDIKIVNIIGQANQKVEDAAVEYLIKQCPADGPEISFDCKSLKSIEAFTTESGIQGNVIYLNGEIRNLRGDFTTPVTKGPYFIFMKGTSATVSNFIIIEPPINKFTDEIDQGLVRQIALSLKFD
jgi:hypothetical protein